MKRFENILMKIVVAHIVLLFIGQLFLQHSEMRPYLSKVVQSEGVGKMSIDEWIETITNPTFEE